MAVPRDREMTALSLIATKSFADFPDVVFRNIIAYLDWFDVGRFDNALLDIISRDNYLDALKIAQVKVEPTKFWDTNLRKGILNWMILRNIWVISWVNNSIDDTILTILANTLHKLKSLSVSNCSEILVPSVKIRRH